MEAGICRLPFSPMMVEFSATNEFRWMILLEEIDGVDDKYTIKCQCVFLHLKTDTTYYSSRDAKLFMDTQGFSCENVRVTQDAHAAICAVTMALLLLNTKGIEKEVITPTKFNAVRQKSGKPAVPTITVLRIGTVYDRNDKGHKYIAGTGHKRVHFRSGYTRRQHYGPQNSLVKMVHIPSCLVNYNPELGDKPQLPEKRVRL
jgi:hypothetical protein